MQRLVRLMLLGCWGMMPAAAGQLVDAFKGVDTEGPHHANNRRTAVNTRGLQGETALHWAAFHGRQADVARLITRGADINAAVNNGNTPLHQAAYAGHKEIVELLITQGATINPRTRSGLTPLDWAKRNGHRAVMQVLLAHGGRHGAASGPHQSSDHRQTTTGSQGTDTLPDAVQFAALGYLPTLPTRPVPVTVSTDHSPPVPEFRVQLAAMQSESAARLMWRQYVTRHPATLAGLQPSVVPARVNGMPFYRVQGGPLTEGAAHRVCGDLRRANQACLVVRASASSPQQN